MASGDFEHDRHDRVEPGTGNLEPAGNKERGELGPKSEEGFDLGQIWLLLRANGRMVLAVAGALFGLVMLVTLASRMEFRSSGRLYLGDLAGKSERSATDSAPLDLSSSAQGDVGSEVEILKSQSLITRAILDSGLNVTITPESWRPPRYLFWLASGRDPRLLEGASKELAAMDASLPDDARDEQTYHVRFITATSYELWSEDQDKRLALGRLQEPVSFGGVKLTLLPGSARAPRAGARYEIQVHPMQEVLNRTLKALNVVAPKSIGSTEPIKVITLDFTHGSPVHAAAFLRRLMAGYLEQRQSWKTEEATAAERFVTEQLRGMRESLEKTEQKLAEYRINTPVVVLDNEAKAMIEQVGKYEEQRVAAHLQVSALSDMKSALKNPNATMETFLLGEGNDSVLQGLAKSLQDARTELARLEERLTPAAPEVKEKRAQVEKQLEMIRGYVTSRLSRAQGNLGSLNRIIGQFEEKLKTVPGAELGLEKIARESEVYSKLYSYLLERQQQAAISKASTVSKNRILDVPQPIYREDSPKLGFRLASALLGLLLGAAYVLVRHMTSSSLESESDVRRSLAGYPISASIPQRRAEPTDEDRPEPRPFDVLAGDPGSLYAEAYRMLRANLYLATDNALGQVVLVTSPTDGDGKTTCTLALAAALAADGKLVLVIDSDIRTPSHHELTGRPATLGLSSILTGSCEWQRAVQRVPLAIGELYSIATGPRQSPELLSSDELLEFLALVKSRFDFVLLDSASFPQVSDALVLGRAADHVLTVVRLHHTPRRLAVEHARLIAGSSRSHAIVVNGVPSARTTRSQSPTATQADLLPMPPEKPQRAPAPITLS